MNLAELILSVMLTLRPQSEFKDSFENTAQSISIAASRSPVFTGANGDTKTAFLLLAIGEFESGFQPDVEGDCDKTTDKGICVKGSKPHSFCFMQIHESNFKEFRTSREKVQTDIDECISVGLSIIHQSFRNAHKLPLDEKLRFYTGGRYWNTDDAKVKSKHRIDRAMWLFNKFGGGKL